MQGRDLRGGKKVIRGWNDEASKEVTEGGRGTGCEGHRNNARREIIPQRQRTVALCFEQILNRPWSRTWEVGEVGLDTGQVGEVGEAKLRMTEHSARREQEKTAQSLLEY